MPPRRRCTGPAPRNIFKGDKHSRDETLDPVTREYRPTHEVLAERDARLAKAGIDVASLTAHAASLGADRSGLVWSGGADCSSHSPQTARPRPDPAPPNLAEAYLNPNNCPGLFVTQDRREMHFLVPLGLHGFSTRHNQQRFFILALRFVQLVGGEFLVSWCSSLMCAERSKLGSLCEGRDFQAETPGTLLQGAAPLCPCGELMVKGLGGEMEVRRLLKGAAATVLHEGAALRQRFTLKWMAGISGIAVRAGPSFADWGVVLQHRKSKRYFCRTCRKDVHRCSHVAALGHLEGPEARQVTPSAGAFKRKLECS